MSDIAEIIRVSRGLAHKTDLQSVFPCFDAMQPVRLGDDCAAIPDGDGYLLFAIEGFIEEFVASDPYFAGYCGVMVNASDIYAMGGRPIAVVDAIWSAGGATASPALRGLADAARIYNIPVVGGHSNLRAPAGQLAVAILGRARRLLTSFDAVPGDVLVAAIDLRGAFRGDKPYWDASTGRRPEDLRAALDVLPAMAEAGLCRAAKDISMAGLIGTALMLAEASNIGMTLCLDDIPAPPSIDRARWLTAFPSFGFLLAVKSAHVADVLAAFDGVGVAACTMGVCDDTRAVVLNEGGENHMFWDFAAENFMNLAGPHA